jgi:RHS repeat-associated protein
MTSISQKLNHTYDPANRLTSVNGQAVQWDDNGREAPLGRRSLPPERGNMLADGQAVYTYNTANKLVGVTKGTSSIVYAYSGMGDRLKQIADGVTTDYTLDINAGLTQVLDDGTNKYLYGKQRIAQIAPTQTGYFLPDALGSMRQITDELSGLTLARSYDPYGSIEGNSGVDETIYGYTGEIQDGGLINLRTRDYSINIDRFLQLDRTKQNFENTIELNKYIYGRNNPVRYVDPTGKTGEDFIEKLFGLDISGNWTNEDRFYIEYAVSLVSNRFLEVYKPDYKLGERFTIIATAITFQQAYGISKDNPMKFEWNPSCYFCRPLACQVEDKWETITDVNQCNPDSCNTCYCKPVGGFTYSANRFEFASVWPTGFANYSDRRVNNVIHELGHAFDSRIKLDGRNSLNTENPIILNNEWSYISRPDGFYISDPINNPNEQTWMQSLEISASEIFADMFLGWVFDNHFSSDAYGEARSEFMDRHMPIWIDNAINQISG